MYITSKAFLYCFTLLLVLYSCKIYLYSRIVTFVNIDLSALLHQNDILLLFVVLALGLGIGKIRIAKIAIGKSIGVLLAAILLGHHGFTFSAESLSLGFMLFIFCVGIEAGPNFFGIFFRDGTHYLILTFTIILVAISLTLLLANHFHLGLGTSVGMMAGSLTSTPILVAAKDALNSGMSSTSAEQLANVIDSMSVGYAMAYLIGLVSLVVLAKLLPKLQHQDLKVSAEQIAKERGLDGSGRPKARLPIIRAYRVDSELLEWAEGKTLFELGIYRRTGCYIERIRRSGMLAKPDGQAILQKGDDIALVGYPENHTRLDSSIRNGKEVFDKDLLDLRIVEERIVVKNDNLVGKRLGDLNLSDNGCFLTSLVRAQIEMPLNDGIILSKGDVLEISGEKSRVLDQAEKIGFIAIHSQISDLLAFCSFFIFGILLGNITITLGQLTIGLGNAAGLLIAGISLGYMRANHPTFGYVPQAALNIAKDFGLMVFMVGVGLSAGTNFLQYVQSIGPEIFISGLAVSVIPVLVAYLVGAYVLKMNRALLFGALIGARTCAPAMDMINEYARSSIPALGYAGTYAIANVLLTLAGTFFIAFS